MNKAKLDIVFLGEYNVTDRFTGPEKVARRIYDIANKKHNCEFWEYFQNGAKYSYFKKLFAFKIVDSQNSIYRVGIIRLIFRFIKYKPKIVHIIIFRRYTLFLIILKCFIKYKLIYNVHGISSHEDKSININGRITQYKNNFIENLIFKKADIVLSLSALYNNLLIKYTNIKQEKIHKIANGIDSFFKRECCKKKHSNILSLVFVANLLYKEKKGLLFLLDSIKMINFNVILYIINCNETSNINIEINNKYVKLFKTQFMSATSLSDFYKDKDIIITASSYDSFNIAVAEAMSSGLVPVVTNETGISEYINSGINGFTYNYGESEKLVIILSQLNENRKMLSDISNNAQKIYKDLRWEIVYEKYYKNIYEEYLKF